MRTTIATLIAVGVGFLASVAGARSAPAGLDLHTKDQCKNICVMARVTCEDNCKALPKKKQPACYLKCPKKEASCKETCAAAIQGHKTNKELQKEDRAHQRGLDRPGQAPPMPQPSTIPPSLEHSGVGG